MKPENLIEEVWRIRVKGAVLTIDSSLLVSPHSRRRAAPLHLLHWHRRSEESYSQCDITRAAPLLRLKLKAQSRLRDEMYLVYSVQRP
jgi:hypothetical protein